MRAIWAIIRKFLLLTVRRRSTLIFVIGMPLVFTFVFGVLPGMNNSIGIAVVNEDHTPVANATIRSLQHMAGGYHVSITTRDKTALLLRNQQVSYVLQIPKGFQADAMNGTKIPVLISASPNSAEDSTAYITKQTLQTTISRGILAGRGAMAVGKSKGDTGTKLVLDFVSGMQHAKSLPSVSPPTMKMLLGKHVASSLTSAQLAVVGFATMFTIFAVFGQMGSLFEEKRIGTWDRLKASGSSKSSIVAGYSLAVFLMGWLQFLVLLLSGRFIFQVIVPMNGWMILAISLYIMAASGIAMCAYGLVKTAQQMGLIGSFVAVITSMIGGAYWPIDVEPKWMQHVAWFVPQKWAIDAFSAVSSGSMGFQTLMLPLGVLAVFSLVFFSVGVAQLRYS